MHGLSAVELLRIWEQGQKQTFTERALLLLAAACSEIPIHLQSQLSTGQRDRYLLDLQDLTFGSQLNCLVRCPHCSDQSEFPLMTTEIRKNTADPFDEAHAAAMTETIMSEEYEVVFRLPNSSDFLALGEARDGTSPRRQLLERCFLKVLDAQGQVPVNRLPEKVIEAVIDRMSQLDPCADIWLTLTCPSCGRPWQAPFVIVSFLWTEISMMAQRVLYEVHTLSRTYGWSEADILAMSAFRRQCYIEMAAK
jgi:hypothetical protein